MSHKLTISTKLPLPNSDYSIPQLGFGVYLAVGDKCYQSCLAALKAGYRHIDSAQYYENEAEVGEAVRKSDIPRSDIYITSKILFAGADTDESYQKILESVKKIDPSEHGYVDLFLIHNAAVGPEKCKNMWLALEKAKAAGKVRDIGVSNYGKGQLEDMKSYATTWPPVVNQIELHPWCQQREAVSYCESQGIVVQAYCPLVRNQKADDKTLNAVASRHQRSTAHVLIRWSLQKGWVSLPKSETPSRIQANADVYDFELSEEEMKVLDDLDEGEAGSIVTVVKN